MREWKGANLAAFGGEQRHAMDSVSTQLHELTKGVKLLSGNRLPFSGGSVVVGAGVIGDGDKGDVEVSDLGNTWRVTHAANMTFLRDTSHPELIQTSLNELTTGGIVWLGPGTWTVTSTIYMSHPGLTLRGSGDGVTIVQYIADRNTDIIVQEHTSCSVEDMSVRGYDGLGNGLGAAGTGRGIVVAKPDSTRNYANPAYSSIAGTGSAGDGTTSFNAVRRCSVYNTASWAIYDSGLHDLTIVGSNYGGGRTLNGLSLSIGFTLEQVNTHFTASNGCVYIGSGAAFPRINGLKTNNYCYNTFSHTFSAGGPENAMGAVFLYNVYGATFENGCYLQSPSDDGILPDKDATMISFSHCSHCTIDNMKFEVLSAQCADSNNGAGGREFYFITAVNSNNIVFNDPHFQSRFLGLTDTRTGTAGGDGGSTLSNYGVKILRTSPQPSTCGFIFNGGTAIQGRTTIGAASGAKNVGEPATWDRNDFIFAGDGDGNVSPTVIGGECAVMDFHIVINSTGKVREPSTPRDAFNVVCSGTGAPSTSLTTAASFVNVNNGDAVWDIVGPTFIANVRYVTGLTTIVLDAAVTIGAGVTLQFRPYGSDVTRRPGFMWRDRRGPVRNGFFRSCDLTGAGDSDDFLARWSLSHPTLDGVMSYVRSGTLDEGLWVGNSIDGLARQIPFYRRRSSNWPSPKQGDINYRTDSETFQWYNGATAAWETAIKRNIGTAAGDLIKYTASDTPARLAIGSADDLLTVSGGAPVWAAPEFKDNLFKVRDGSDASRYVQLDVGSFNTAGRTWEALDTGGKVPMIVNTNDLTAQTADIGSYALSGALAGVYRVEGYIACTTSDGAAGSVTLTISWTDDIGATTNVSTQVLTATGRAYVNTSMYANASGLTAAVTHTGSYGTAQYALRLRCTFVG